MAEKTTAKEIGSIKTIGTQKPDLPARCAERVKLAQIASDANVPIHLIGASKSLSIGNGARPDDEIRAMYVHPHGLYVESTVKGTIHRIIIPSVNLYYYEIMEG